jgi:hypothetical protein
MLITSSGAGDTSAARLGLGLGLWLGLGLAAETAVETPTASEMARPRISGRLMTQL